MNGKKAKKLRIQARHLTQGMPKMGYQQHHTTKVIRVTPKTTEGAYKYLKRIS